MKEFLPVGQYASLVREIKVGSYPRVKKILNNYLVDLSEKVKQGNSFISLNNCLIQCPKSEIITLIQEHARKKEEKEIKINQSDLKIVDAALSHAILKDDLTSVRFFCSKKMVIEYQFLKLAIHLKRLKIIQYLLKQNAETDKDNESSLLMFTLMSINENQNLFLIKLLLDHKADPNKKFGSTSPLSYAIDIGRPDLVKVLISQTNLLPSETTDLLTLSISSSLSQCNVEIFKILLCDSRVIKALNGDSLEKLMQLAIIQRRFDVLLELMLTKKIPEKKFFHKEVLITATRIVGHRFALMGFSFEVMEMMPGLAKLIKEYQERLYNNNYVHYRTYLHLLSAAKNHKEFLPPEALNIVNKLFATYQGRVMGETKTVAYRQISGIRYLHESGYYKEPQEFKSGSEEDKLTIWQADREQKAVWFNGQLNSSNEELLRIENCAIPTFLYLDPSLKERARSDPKIARLINPNRRWAFNDHCLKNIKGKQYTTRFCLQEFPNDQTPAELKFEITLPAPEVVHTRIMLFRINAEKGRGVLLIGTAALVAPKGLGIQPYCPPKLVTVLLPNNLAHNETSNTRPFQN